MVYKDGKEISSFYKNNAIIFEIYKGTTLVWQAIRSCFGKGFWINTESWSNIDGWKNNI